MNGLPSIDRLTKLLSRFPGVGKKSAGRMIHHLLKGGPEEISALVRGLTTLQERVTRCPVCGNLAEGELCWVCGDPKRNRTLLCVVEEPSDLMAIEKAGAFRGLYHVLGGRLSPLDGVGPDALSIASLLERLGEGSVEEMIIGVNPTVEGNATAHYVAQAVRERADAEGREIKITRLAHGIPMGGELEYLDESTLFQALSGRREY